MFAQRLTAIATVLVFVQSGICAVRGDKAEYRGGTVTSIPKGAQGRIDADGPKEMIFRMNGGQEWRLPYASITALEYGSKVGHRTGAGVGLGLAFGIVPGLIVGFSHKEKHYLAIGFKQADGTPGAAVFELAKDVSWTAVNALEVQAHVRAESTDGEKISSGGVMPTARATPTPAPVAEAPKPTPTPTPVPRQLERQPDTEVVKLPG
jgi:hypothetical protein